MVISVRLCSFLWESKWKWRESFRLCRQIIMAVKLLMNQTNKMRVGSVIFRGERRGRTSPFTFTLMLIRKFLLGCLSKKGFQNKVK